MYICICRAVTDRALAQAARDGARTVDELAARTGAGTGCGACRPMLQTLVGEPEGRASCTGACADCPARTNVAA